MTKKIFTIEYSIPDENVTNLSFRSSQSLLDSDIIIIDLDFLNRYSYKTYEDYEGKPLLETDSSHKIYEDTLHWKSEINSALLAGKTIIVYLSRFETVYRYTGEKQFSGTGRNQKTTNIVTPFRNYDVLPISPSKIIPKSGKEIKIAKDLGSLSTYWNEFSKYSTYETYLEGSFDNTVLTTKAGEKTVGAVVKREKGSLFLLPPLNNLPDSFYTQSKKWSQQGKNFWKKFISILVETDKAARAYKEITPIPEWVKSEIYILESEQKIQVNIDKVNNEIEKLTQKVEQLQKDLGLEGSLRNLLFERGAILEEAILETLRLMGFSADNYKESESEFDAIFTSEEGRFLGEAEGKDNKAVNIDKLSQLERNLQEDFAREDVTDYAKGVLFGNAFRLNPIESRGDFFTQKCLSGAKRSKVALVRTPDLFPIAKYLKETKDTKFAKQCREALLKTEGEIVQFPDIPK